MIRYIIKFVKRFFEKRRGYDCNFKEIVGDENVSKYSVQQVYKIKRDYCLRKCKHNCNELIMLKKIYWELRKANKG